MFTGIIQDIGFIEKSTNDKFEITTKLKLNNSDIGSSICCNGVCLTVTDIKKNIKKTGYIFLVNISEETKMRSNIEINKPINIEKSLKIGDQIGGHFVYGHVDTTFKILKIIKLKNSWEIEFDNSNNKFKKYIVDKASISINGISLTIAKIIENSFYISIIPHTFYNTNLQYLNNNDLVNVEFDYLARFILNQND